MSDRFSGVMDRPVARYAMALAAVAASVLLCYLLVQGLGMEMPAFITFYPAIMLVALLAGFWPGIFATALSVLSWNYLFLAPIGHSVADRASDIVALSLFSAMGVFISLVAEYYRRSLRAIADLQAEQLRRESEDKLRQASEYRRLALDAASLGAWDLQIETGEVFWDDSCRTGYGFPSGHSVTYEEAIARILPEDRPGVDEAVKQAVAGVHDGAYHREYRVAWPDGSIHWIASHGRVYFDGEGDRKRPVRFLGVNADITGNKQMEQHLRQLNRIYTVLSDVNQTIVREKDSAAMLEAACRIAVEKGQFRMAWIGMVNPDTQVLEPVASSGVVEGYLDRIRIDFGESAPDAGPAARCFFSGRHAICNDIEHEIRRPCLESASPRNYFCLLIMNSDKKLLR